MKRSEPILIPLPFEQWSSLPVVYYIIDQDGDEAGVAYSKGFDIEKYLQMWKERLGGR